VTRLTATNPAVAIAIANCCAACERDADKSRAFTFRRDIGLAATLLCRMCWLEVRAGGARRQAVVRAIGEGLAEVTGGRA
jgi:hypothetical protein